MSKLAGWRGNALALGVGLVLCVAMTEIVLRVHNPIPLPVRGKRIMLAPNTSVEELSPVPGSPKLEPRVDLRTNAIGLRGEDPPPAGSPRTRVITIGGSTTLNRFASHEKSWPGQLAEKLKVDVPDVWLNNAGLDGNTTYGHRMLLEQYIFELKPDYVLFLIGVNDVGRAAENHYDGFTESALRDMVIEKSELLSTLQVIWRATRAKRRGLSNTPLDFTQLPRKEYPAEYVAKLHKDLDPLLPGYEARVRALLAGCRERGIEPVLITQPALWGDLVDPTLGIPLGDIDSEAGAEVPSNARMRWAGLERYNDVTRRVGQELGVLTVDLARQLPKDSALYFDWIHYSLPGNEQVATIVAQELGPFIAKRKGAAAPP